MLTDKTLIHFIPGVDPLQRDPPWAFLCPAQDNTGLRSNPLIHKSVAPLHTNRSSDIKRTVRSNETYVRDKIYVHDVASTGRIMHEMQAEIESEQVIAHLYRTAVVKSSDFIFLPSARTPLEDDTCAMLNDTLAFNDLL
jgi:hypothetical protein